MHKKCKKNPLLCKGSDFSVCKNEKKSFDLVFFGRKGRREKMMGKAQHQSGQAKMVVFSLDIL